MFSIFNRVLFAVALFFALLTSVNTAAAFDFTARLPLYSDTSKLSSGNWVKCRIAEDGIYKITFDQMRAMGFKNPEKVRVFGYGGRLLNESLNSDYLDDLPEVNIKVGDSYILFYGVANVRWIYKNTANPFYFSKNSYSDYGYYFLSDIDGKCREVAQIDEIAEEPEDLLCNHLKNVLTDPNVVNIHEGGNDWYDEPLSVGASKNYSFYCPDMIPGDNGYLTAYWHSPTNNSILTISANDWKFLPTADVSSSKKYLSQPYGDYLKVNAKYTNSVASALGYLNYIKVSVLCNNSLKSGYLSFGNVDGRHDFGVCDVAVVNADSKTIVWNVTDPNNVFAYTTKFENDTLKFRVNASTYNSFVAFNEKDCKFKTVETVGVVSKQNLHNFKGADLVILSPAVFSSYAKQIGELHAEYDGLSYLVVTPELIYNEFSSGTPDPTAIRAFLKMLYDRATADPSLIKPRYLLLFGDGSYDNRGISGNVNNFLPTYQFSSGDKNGVSDDYFGILVDGPNGSSSVDLNGKKLQVAVGRLPVSNYDQASGVVNKIKRYIRNEELDSWKLKMMLIADDDEGRENVYGFMNYAENTSNYIYGASPSIQIKKVYLDNYKLAQEASGRRYPDVETTIVNEVSDGSAFVFYFGHSNPINWASEKVFTQSQVASLTNKKLGLWYSGSCSFARFDGNVSSCSESLVLAPNGGAIAILAPPRDASYTDGYECGIGFSRALFPMSSLQTVGDAMLKSKQTHGFVSFSLIGDPALRLNLPLMKVVSDSMSADTLTAFSRVTVYGHISDEGQLVSNFNGRVKIRVYDKIQSCNTKGNSSEPAIYYDYASTLFSGEVDVVGGRFSCQFIVPKDIVYSYGNGRISFYAYDNDNKFDAEGGTKVVVGGSCDSVISDSLGPAISMFINNSSFRSGDVVGANPVLVAYVSDENGINASGVGLGHDISLSLNGGDPVTINDCFSYTSNSSSDGYLQYRFNDLADGVYTVKFKVWDLLNNSSTKTISFIVDKEKGEHIYSVNASPNPASSSTQIVVDYGHPLVNVDYEVAIYNAQGVLVNRSIGVENSADGKLQLHWNLNDSNGNRVHPGVYVFRVDVRSGGESFSGMSEKIVVLPQ